MVDNSVFDKAIDAIKNSTDAIITSHTRPDGDGCGCVRAMCDVLKHLGKNAHPIFMSPLPKWYEFMFDHGVSILGNDVTKDQLHGGYYDECDLVIIVDTNSYVQLPVFDEWLRENKKTVLILDHHITGDGLGDIELIDPEAAATGEIVLDLLKYAGWPITEQIAESLFIALATDSGWFKFGNTDSRIFRNAAELVDSGARPPQIYRKLYQNVTPARMRLMARMLTNMELIMDDRIAIQCIMRKDFDETGASGPDTENLIDECQRIGSVEGAALFVELADGGFRCSLRSKGKIDVQKIASRYGGGGHKMASGVNLQGPFENARKLIVGAFAEQL